MGNVGPAEILIISIFALLIFGPEKLPEMARSVGRAVRELKKATGEFTQEFKTLDETAPAPSKPTATPGRDASKEPPELRPGPR